MSNDGQEQYKAVKPVRRRVVNPTGLNPSKPMWSAEERAQMCGCGKPEEHSDDRTTSW